MQAQLTSGAAEKAAGDALILPVFQGARTVPKEATALDKKLNGAIGQLLKDEFRGRLMEVAFVHNPDYTKGLSSSLKAGIGAVPEAAGGAGVLLGDMPQITAAHLDHLIAALAEDRGNSIIVPTHAGKRGNPVLWPRAYFAEMLQLEGDAGARRLLAAHASRVREVDVGTDAIFADVDTPEALAELRGGQTPRA